MSADLSNWREGSQSKWSFQNIDKVLNTHIAKKGPNTRPLEPSKPANFDTFKLQLSEDKPALDFSAFLTYTDTDGIVILKDGKIVHEHYDRTNDANSKHIMMSMTKSVTGLLAGILSDKGKLDVDAPLTKYVPEIKGTSLENGTVRQCLDMRTNVKYDDASPAYRAAAGWNPVSDDETDTNLHKFISTFQAEQIPSVEGLDGAPFEYVSVNTDLMGWVLERAGGKKFAELLSELLWQPMGAESDALVTVDRNGNARTAGGMCAVVRDIARLGQLVLEGGRGIVPGSWIEDMAHNGSEAAFKAGPWAMLFRSIADNVTYRSYWITGSGGQMLMGMGIHGQLLFVDRANGIVVAKTSSQPERFDVPKAVAAFKAFGEIRRILTT